MNERDAIVKWLREVASNGPNRDEELVLLAAAFSIERGEHLRND